MTAHTVTHENTRTSIAKSVQCRHTGKWSSCFEMWRTFRGEEYKISEVTSPPLFENEQLADDAAYRAMTVLEGTGRFPNMCQMF